jgi:hypothetical protein
VKIEIENLKAKMRGENLNAYQRGLALNEHFKMIGYVNELERLTTGNRELKILWLDDLRNPFLNEENKLPKEKGVIHWVLNYYEFTAWINKHGLPDIISFDHDLAEEHYTPEYFWDDYDASKKFQDWKSKSYKQPTGEGCADFLIDYCIVRKLYLPKFYVHSANPVGADKIRSLLLNHEIQNR